MPIKKVLVVDDSPTERFHLVEILQRGGFEAETAENGEEGIAKAKLVRPDLILMDVVMPGVNGFQVTRTLSRDPDTKDIPVIMCTSKGQETDRVWGMRQGAVAYLVKPIVAEDLLDKIEHLS
ncbi:response regulator [Parasulfuritortus cantonensis]|uniref:Response regulator n=1 Tax=Parasulfuritortus cantonensis TaxID=2528202 RepID=A0A4R1BJ25_9PROT|nr:response regulator [Parasulfuritortus cantonensis]TCJ17217.1 response regulator [Parasulfuritortus cantonensis]